MSLYRTDLYMLKHIHHLELGMLTMLYIVMCYVLFLVCNCIPRLLYNYCFKILEFSVSITIIL